MKVYRDIPGGRGYRLRVSREFYEGHQRIDCRVCYETRPADPDTLRPTQKGLNLQMRDLPAFVSALQEAEAEAIREGRLSAKDYKRAGLEPPPALRPVA